MKLGGQGSNVGIEAKKVDSGILKWKWPPFDSQNGRDARRVDYLRVWTCEEETVSCLEKVVPSTILREVLKDKVGGRE